MLTIKTCRAPLLAGVTLLLMSCGDPTGTTSGDELSDAEVQAILSELAGSLGGIAGVPALARHAPDPLGALLQVRAVPVKADFDETAPCQEGNIGIKGSVDGDVDQEAQTGSFSFRVTWTINDCVVTVQETDFTVNDDPPIVFDADFTLDENSLYTKGTEKGGFRFTGSDGRQGTCGINMSFEISVTLSGGAATSKTSGTVCGRNADSFIAYGGDG
jgi:hypothetical protein